MSAPIVHGQRLTGLRSVAALRARRVARAARTSPVTGGAEAAAPAPAGAAATPPPPPRLPRIVRLDLKNAPSAMEQRAAGWAR